jgi:hypothetical protein
VLPNKPPPVAGAVVAGVEPNENGAGEGVWAGVGPVTESCGTPACCCGWAGAVDVDPKLNLRSAITLLEIKQLTLQMPSCLLVGC